MLRRLTGCCANLLLCITRKTASDGDIRSNSKRSTTDRSTFKLSRLFKRRPTKSRAEAKEPSFRKSKRRKEERWEGGFSMYGKARSMTAGKKRSSKKRKRRKTRKERNATLKVNKKNRAKRARRALETSEDFNELRPECELRPQSEAETKRARDRMRGRQRDEHKHKQAELECKRRNHKDRKKDTKSSRRQRELTDPNRHSFRPPKGTHVEGLDSYCYGNERAGRWTGEMGMNQGTEYGIHKEKGRKDRREKKAASSKRDSKADCFDGEDFTNPCHFRDVDPSPRNSWTSALYRVEAWQERCSAEIDTARRKLEHRLTRLEEKLDRQTSEKWDEALHVEEAKEILREEYERMFGRVTGECHTILANQREMLHHVIEEIRAEIQAGFDRLEETLAHAPSFPTQKPGTERDMDCRLMVRLAKHSGVGYDIHTRSTRADSSGGIMDGVTAPTLPQNGAPVPSRVSQSDALDAREEPGSVVSKGTKIDDTTAHTHLGQTREPQRGGELEQSEFCASSDV